MTLFLIFALAMMVASLLGVKASRKSNQLDERQLLLRGRGYKYAFWVIVLFNLVYGFACFSFDRTLATPFAASLATIILGGTVFSCYCIFQDAFPAKGRLSLAAAWTLIFFSQLIIQIGELTSGRVVYIKNGMLTDAATGPMILATYLAIIVSFLIKAIIDRREEA